MWHLEVIKWVVQKQRGELLNDTILTSPSAASRPSLDVRRGITTTSGTQQIQLLAGHDTTSGPSPLSPPSPTLKNEEKLSLRDGTEQMRPIYHEMLRPTTTHGHTPTLSMVLLELDKTQQYFQYQLKSVVFLLNFLKKNASLHPME